MNSLILAEARPTDDGQGFILHTVADNLRVLATDKRLVDANNGKSVRKIGLSLCSGCMVGCIYCFTNRFSKFRPLTLEEIIEQVEIVIGQKGEIFFDFDETKISFKQMGDPLLNPENLISAMESLHEQFPDLTFVVSTSGPKQNTWLFDELAVLQQQGLNIRLQFSCHTTSDAERKFLSPKIPMLTFPEIAGFIKNWPGTKVTLNFVLLDGFDYDLGKIQELGKEKVFIKVNFLDPNSQLKKHGLKDLSPQKVKALIKKLKEMDFDYAFRHGHPFLN